MMTQKCNGWTNYETWVTVVWLEDQAKGKIEELATEVVRDALTLYDASNTLKEFIQENKPIEEGLYGDLLGAAISEINFREIIETTMKDIELEEEENEEEEDEENDEFSTEEFEEWKKSYLDKVIKKKNLVS